MNGDPLGLGRYLLDDQTAQLCSDWMTRLAAGREFPEYGSPEWLRAPRDLQIAAALYAAEAHRRDGLFRAQDLADRFEAEQWAAEQQDQREFADLARNVRAMAHQPTHAELVQRRSVPHRPVEVAC